MSSAVLVPPVSHSWCFSREVQCFGFVDDQLCERVLWLENENISSSVRRGCGKELGCSKGSPVLNFLCQSIPKPRWSNKVSTLSSSLGRQHLKNQHYQLLELGTSACDHASSGWHAASLTASWAIGTENQCCDSQLVIPTAVFSALLGAWESFFGKVLLDRVA